DTSDLPRLLAAAARHPNHIIIGARLRHRAAAPRLRRMANAFGDWGVSWGAGYRIADSQSGQRYYPAAVVELQDVPGEDFVFRSDASALPRLLAAAARHPSHITIGARLRHRAAAPRLRRMANAFGDWGVSWGAGYRIADSQSGQRYYLAAVVALQDVPGEAFVF